MKINFYKILITFYMVMVSLTSTGQTFIPYIDNPVVDTLNTSNPSEYWTRWKSDPCVIHWGKDSLRMYYGTNNFGKTTQIGTAVSVDGNTWIEKRDQPVIQVGPAGAWDDRDIETPYVIHVPSNPDSMRFMAWYTGATADSNLLDTICGTFFSVIHQMGMAYSPDGISWTKYNNPGNDTSSLYRESDPVLKIPYTGGCLPDSIGYNSFAIAEPCVLYDSVAGLYKMWYIGLGCSIPTCGGNDYRHRILYSESANGIDWSQPALSLDIGSEGEFDSEQVYAPDVVLLDDEYWMFYCGRNTATTAISQWNMKIGLAKSSDGIYFNKDASNPLIPDGVSGAWNDYGSNFPSVIVFHDTLRVYYSGLQDTTTNLLPKIGYSFMESSVLSGTGDKESIFEVVIFPNPTVEFLNVRLFESPRFPYDVTLYDPKGNIVFTKTEVFQKELKIPLIGYSEGTYIITCQYNGRRVSDKVIISW